MCGRYASARKRHELLEEFEVERDETPVELSADYNVAPTKSIYAVLTGRPRGSRTETVDEQDVARELRVVRWGLVPTWAKNPSVGSKMINARVETVAEKPAFRRAFERRRCLLPADGFFEWLPLDDSKKPRKQPYFIHPRDGGVLAMAGLYELWRDSTRSDDDPLRWLWSATIITTEAEDEVGRIHDRMPMLVGQDHWPTWLDPEVRNARDLLVPALAGGLTAYAVSTAVNDVRNNGPELVEPLPEGGNNGEYSPTLF